MNLNKLSKSKNYSSLSQSWKRYEKSIPKRKTFAMLNNEEVLDVVEKKYADFCIYRYDIHTQMADWGKNLYNHRVYDGTHFNLDA